MIIATKVALLCIVLFCLILYWACTEGVEIIQENDFIVPEQDRIPIGEYHRDQFDIKSSEIYDKSKRSYFYTQFMDVASPLTDGFHDLMPLHNRWKGGKIVMGETIGEQNTQQLNLTRERLDQVKNNTS